MTAVHVYEDPVPEAIPDASSSKIAPDEVSKTSALALQEITESAGGADFTVILNLKVNVPVVGVTGVSASGTVTARNGSNAPVTGLM
jgi:hypothetical protein